MDNPFALLMNLGVGTPNAGQTLASPFGAGAAVPGAESIDLLGFVNALEVSQGPASPLGEDLGEMTEALVEPDLKQKKMQNLADASSGELLTSMLSTENPALKTDSFKTVGHSKPANTEAALQVPATGRLVSGETQLLGDLNAVNMMSTPALKMALKGGEEKLAEKDVAAWSQAFAQNDVESIEVLSEPVTPFEKAQKSEKLASSEHVKLGSTVEEPALAPVAVRAVASSAQRSTSDRADSSFTAFRPSDAAVRTETSSSKDKPARENVALDASELMLGRDMILDAAPTKDASGVVKSAATLGAPSDTRLSDDSVKMLADKIESLKDSGSSTLRVVLNPTEGGKIEIRVQKIGGELRVHLKADSKEMAKALEVSKPELVSQLAERVSAARVEVGSELLGSSVAESSKLSSLKNVLHSGDVLRMGQGSELRSTTTSSSTSDFGSSDMAGRQGQQEFREQQGREQSRDRGMKQWQGVFEERESA
jgi:flagellar hook-length control protein FliK